MNLRTSRAGLAAAAAIFAAITVWAQSTLQFRPVVRNTNGETVLTLTYPSNVNYRVDTCEHLAETNASNWNAFLTLPPGPGSLQHTDTASPYLLQRFYRAHQLSGSSALTGDHIATTNGDIVIRPVNHASLVLSWQNILIYNDPVGGSAPYASFARPNLILVSHSHSDHYNGTTLEGVRTANTIIVAPQAVYNAMSTALKAVTTVLTNDMTTNVLGMHIQAVPAYNANHARGTGNGYVLTIAGKRLLFTGDTGDIPELRALPNIDVAFICMNLPFTMSITNAASMVREFQPRIVYPYHYRNGDSTFPDLMDFKRRVGQDQGIEVRLRKWY